MMEKWSCVLFINHKINKLFFLKNVNIVSVSVSVSLLLKWFCMICFNLKQFFDILFTMSAAKNK